MRGCLKHFWAANVAVSHKYDFMHTIWFESGDVFWSCSMGEGKEQHELRVQNMFFFSNCNNFNLKTILQLHRSQCERVFKM